MNIDKLFLDPIVYLDGAMGSRLIAAGRTAESGERYSLTDNELIAQIHASYIKAGSQIIYANTFGLNALNFHKDEILPIANAAYQAADSARKSTGKGGVMIAFSIGPLKQLLEPYGDITVQEAQEMYSQLADYIKDSSYDLVVCETFTDLAMLQIALEALSVCKKPLFCSMSVNQDGRTLMGNTLEEYADAVQKYGVRAIGLNCGGGPDMLLLPIKKLLSLVKIPVLAKPNAGLPVYKEGKTVYDMDAESFSIKCAALVKAGVKLIGGCCGTDDTYIQSAKKAIGSLPKPIDDR